MKFGTYEIETYNVVINGRNESRQRIIYYNNNNSDKFVERYNGYVRPGYTQLSSYFTHLKWTNIQSNVVGESIVVYDNSTPQKPLIYFTVAGLESIQREGDYKLIIINSQTDEITLEFDTVFDASQAYSILNYVLGNPSVNISTLSSDVDIPIITFNDSFRGSLIYVYGTSTTGSLTTLVNDRFSIDIPYDPTATITKTDIISDMIFDISDNRDVVVITEEEISFYINDIDKTPLDIFSNKGSYLIEISIKDLSLNESIINIYLNIV
jgi:hypothetical protein